MATIEKNPAREVLNQAPPLEGYNVYESNVPLVEAVRREGAEAFEERIRTLGARAGTAESLERGRLANENPPTLRTHDRYGNRIDEVEFHPAWHELLELSVAAAVHALPWREPVPGAQAGRAAMMLAMSGVESGTGCPLSMTYAGVPALRVQPGRVRPRMGPARGRGRARCLDDHRDGQLHAARLRARVDRSDAHGRGPGRPPLRAPVGVRQAADRPAADAQRARRPVRGVRGGHPDGHAPGACLRRGRPVQAPRPRRLQVLDLQERRMARGRGARVSGRERLRGAVGDAAALPRGTAELDLGGLRERQLPRRAARDGALAGVGGGVLHRGGVR